MEKNLETDATYGAPEGYAPESTAMLEGMELPGRRKANEKHFDLGGGRRQAVIYPEPVHFEARGRWREIDNNLERAVSRDGRRVWRNKASALEVELPERADDGALVTLRHGGKTLGWRFAAQAGDARARVRGGQELRRERLLSLAQQDARFRARSAGTLSDNELNALQTEEDRRVDQTERYGEVCFDEVLPGVSVKYLIRGERLKEDIILADKAAIGYAELSLEGDFAYQLWPNGAVAVRDEGGTLAFMLGAPVAYDANGAPLTVRTSLNEASGRTILRYVIPEAELDGAAFPITIDPETTLRPQDGQLQCMSVKSNGTNSGLNPSHLAVGTGSAGYDNIILLRFDKLCPLKASDTVIQARLRMTATAESGTNIYTSACRLTGSWTEDTTHEEAQARIDDAELDFRTGGGTGKRLDFDITNLFRTWYTVEDGVRQNFGVALRKPKGMPNAGNYQELYGPGAASDYRPFMIINYISHAGVEGWWQYEQMSAGRAGTAYVDLFNGTCSATHQDTAMSGANTSVSVAHHYNSCPANMEAESGGADESVEGGASEMPDYHCGKNWKLSVQQFIYTRSFNRTNGENITYWIWVDGDGTEHYFRITGKVSPYRDREGLGLTIEKNDPNALKPERYTIRTKSGLSMTFQKKGKPSSTYQRNRSWLTHIFKTERPATANKQRTESTIYYYGDAGETGLDKAYAEGRVTRIVDAAGRETTFDYDTSHRLSRITAPGRAGQAAKVTDYSYDEHDRLASIRYSDLPGTGPHTAYTYDEASGLLTGLNNYDSVCVKIGYEAAGRYDMDLFPGADANSMRNVTSLEGRGSIGGATAYGKKILFEYQSMQTVATVVEGIDEDDTTDKRLIYQFNDRGNVTATRDGLGYAHFAQYEEGERNALTASSKVQRVVINRLRKSDLSEVGAGAGNAWVISGAGTLTRATADADRCLNASSIKMVRASGGTESVCKQTDIPLAQGHSYVLSAYVKAAGSGVNAFLRVTVDGTIHTGGVIDAATPEAMGNDLPTDGWERVQLAFSTAGGLGRTTAQVELVSDGTGGTSTVSFACPQLEEGEIVSSVNLLTNGDFEAHTGGKPNDWQPGSNIVDGDGEGPYVRTPGVGDTPALPPLTGGNVVKIVGRPSKDGRNFVQELSLKGKKNDLFFVGGWANARSAPGANTDDRGFRLLVKFRQNGTSDTWKDGARVPFGFEWVEWQYTGGPVKAPFDYDRVQVFVIYMMNVNEAYFTNIFLFREAYGKSFGYDAGMNLVSAETLAGTQTQMTYDGQDNMTSYLAPGRTSSSDRWNMTYGDSTSEKQMHLVRSVTSPEGVRHVYSYDDDFGNRTADSIIPSGASKKIKTGVRYDAKGNYAVKMIDQRGYTTEREVDAATGVVTRATPAASRQTSTNEFAPVSGAQSVSYAYDGSDRLTEVSAAVSGVGTYKNEYTYDQDRLKTIRHNTSGNSYEDVVYEFGYDGLGAQKEVKVGGTTLSKNVYAADRSHKLTEVEYGPYGVCGRVRYAYDAFDRMTGVSYDNETAPRYTYAYGANGQVARVTDTNLSRIHETTQDLAGRPMQTKQLDLATGGALYETYLKYGKYGNLARFDERIGNKDWQNKYTYDRDDRTERVDYQIRTRGGGTSTIQKNMSVAYARGTYNRTSERTVTNATGTCKAEYAFVLDGNPAEAPSETSLIEKITYSYGGGKDNFQYGYDVRGNIAWARRYAGTTATDGAKVDYAYDKLGQLVRVNDKTDQTAGAGGTTWTYAYDMGGNIREKKMYPYTTETTPTGGITTSYGYGNSSWKDQLTAYAGKTIAYNAIGNPLSYDGWSYEWQAGRQLKKMSRAGVSSSYGTVTVDTGSMTAIHTQGTTDANDTFALSNGSLTVSAASNPYTLANGVLTAGEGGGNARDVEFKYDASGLRVQKVVDGVVTNYTLHGKLITHMKRGMDELHFFYDAESRPAMVEYNGTTYTYLHNLQGDIVAILDAGGSRVVEYGYDAWGRPTGTQGTLKTTLGALNPFRYRGYVWDEETGLYYLRTRYYDPAWGQFLNADGLVGENGQLLRHNVFAYCINDPVAFVDQTGTLPEWVFKLFQMDWLTRAEKDAVSKYPLEALAVSGTDDRAKNLTKERFKTQHEGSFANAYQHALWNALMLKHTSKAVALEFSSAHEAFSKKKLRTRVELKSGRKVTHRRLSKMDLINNDFGATWAHDTFGVGIRYETDGEIADMLYEEMKNQVINGPRSTWSFDVVMDDASNPAFGWWGANE